MATIPTAQQVADFLGRGDDTKLVATAEAQIPVVSAMVERYTRGRGFTGGIPDDNLAAVIISSTARLVTNPSNSELQTVGSFTVRLGVFSGWTLPELAILHSYRRRAT